MLESLWHAFQVLLSNSGLQDALCGAINKSRERARKNLGTTIDASRVTVELSNYKGTKPILPLATTTTVATSHHILLNCFCNRSENTSQAPLKTSLRMTATEAEGSQGYEDSGAGGGPGAPTPLTALEVLICLS